MRRVIETAGTRAQDAGHDSVGEGLVKHARGETGHDLLMVDDARSTASFLGARGGAVLDTEDILKNTPALASAARYNALFERLSAGDEPVCTVAALYEMEQLSAGFAVDLVVNCRRTMDDDPTRFTFLDEHVVVDVGHIALDAECWRRPSPTVPSCSTPWWRRAPKCSPPTRNSWVSASNRPAPIWPRTRVTESSHTAVRGGTAGSRAGGRPVSALPACYQ
ncbi:hypothetical protein ACOBQB_01345 [Streptomyces sp. G5(2025)]|uniref:hypothetical protein n=1 Tax=Streptomyces sp. G5(2025) TaxID=3406628 RepID=UPI003C2902B1